MERCTYQGEWRDEVMRSLITVKALQYAPTGAVCAAATTSLPEQLGGVRNWDYRFSWLRDSALTLQALLLEPVTPRRRPRGSTGCSVPSPATRASSRSCTASAANAGSPRSSSTGFPGYEDSKPVRIGNEASEQFQLDVFGEVADAALTGVEAGIATDSGTPRPSPATG